jgi:hypothetical protein
LGWMPHHKTYVLSFCCISKSNNRRISHDVNWLALKGWESVHQNEIWIINDSIINPLMCSQVDIWDDQLLQVDNWKIISLWTTIEKKYFYSLLINSCVTWFVSIIYIECNYNPCFCTHQRLSMHALML